MASKSNPSHDATCRILIIRYTLILCMLLLFMFGPYTSFYQQEFRDNFVFTYLQSLKYVGIVLLLAAIYCKFSYYALSGAAVIFALIHFNISLVFDTWNFNSHILFFAILVVVAKVLKNEVDTLWFMRIIIATLYFQAGISKLLHGFESWILNCDSIRSALILNGTAMGKNLLQYELAFNYISIFIVALEILGGICLLFPRLRFFASLMFLSMHLGIYLTMKISFWHLWIFFPGLFFPNKLFRAPTAEL